MGNCIICNSNCLDGLILSNGSILHNGCYIELLNKKELAIRNYYSKIEEINQIEKKLNSLPIKILNLVYVNSKKIASLEKNLTSEKKFLKSLENIVSEKSNRISQLYDYWLDYPPDWNDRRDELIKEKKYCQKCYRGYESRVSLHIHHRIPIAQGGTHKKENLSVLCSECHQSKHKHIFSYASKKDKENPFLQKLYLIRKAVEL